MNLRIPQSPEDALRKAGGFSERIPGDRILLLDGHFHLQRITQASAQASRVLGPTKALTKVGHLPGRPLKNSKSAPAMYKQDLSSSP
jgi:hypothetical protein